MFIDHIDKFLGFVGVIFGIEIIAALIFTLSVIYLRNPQIAGVIGNLSSLCMTCTLVAVLLKKGT